MKFCSWHMARSELSYHHEQPQWIVSALLLIQTSVPLAHTQSSEQGLLTFGDSVVWMSLYVCEGFMLLFPWVINSFPAAAIIWNLLVPFLGGLLELPFVSSPAPFFPCSVVKSVEMFLSLWWLTALGSFLPGAPEESKVCHMPQTEPSGHWKMLLLQSSTFHLQYRELWQHKTWWHAQKRLHLLYELYKNMMKCAVH